MLRFIQLRQLARQEHGTGRNIACPNLGTVWIGSTRRSSSCPYMQWCRPRRGLPSLCWRASPSKPSSGSCSCTGNANTPLSPGVTRYEWRSALSCYCSGRQPTLWGRNHPTPRSARFVSLMRFSCGPCWDRFSLNYGSCTCPGPALRSPSPTIPSTRSTPKAP